jgi:putative endopeptidase
MTQVPGIDAKNFDLSIRPQDDLFRHVNGTWLREHEIPADQSVQGSFMKLRDEAELAVRSIIEEAMSNPSEGNVQKIGDFYKSFMDTDRINSIGIAPLEGDLERISAAETLDEMTLLMGELGRGSVQGPFRAMVDVDPGDPTQHILFVWQSGLGLPDESYYREEKYEKFREAYPPFVAKMFKLAGWSDEQAEADAKKVMELETQLAKIQWSVVETRDAEKMYNKRTFAEMQAMSPTFNWPVLLEGLRLPVEKIPHAVIAQPSYFEGLSDVYKAENLHLIKPWMQFGLIMEMTPYLTDEFINARFEFYGKTLAGQQELKARWKRGVSEVEGWLGDAIGKIYVDKHFPTEAKTRMDGLVKWLIEAYRDSITNLDWMTETTKVKALEKLDAFTPKIGYPEKWEDFTSMKIDPTDLVGNKRRALGFWADWQFNLLGAPIEKHRWEMTPQTVNAYYHPMKNEIVFPAAILQPPFFGLEADDAINFGAIGAVIGHEIGHGFDDQGSKFDGTGALVSWWTEDDRAAFEERTKKLIDQYEPLVPLGLSSEHHVQGALTIGENIGDLGGLTIAWQAYLLSLDGKEPPVINGVTGLQRFIYSYAQAWCGKSREEIAIQRLATDPHSPNEFRCNQIVRNFDGFYEAFDVKPGDELWLDPAERVKIW